MISEIVFEIVYFNGNSSSSNLENIIFKYEIAEIQTNISWSDKLAESGGKRSHFTRTVVLRVWSTITFVDMNWKLKLSDIELWCQVWFSRCLQNLEVVHEPQFFILNLA